MNKNNRLKTKIGYTAAFFSCVLASISHLYIDFENVGLMSLMPVIAVLTCAMITKRSVESLLLGCLIGYLMLDPVHFVQKMIDTNLDVLSDGVTTWIIGLTFLVGGLIALINHSGGTQAFGTTISKYAKSRASTLIVTWIMGLIIFVDDYLNALAVGTTMKKLSDKFKVSRQMLAYIVDSTSAPMCVLVPISTWAIFLIGLFEANNVFEKGAGFQGYLELIPYIFYAWIAILMVPIVSMGWIKPLGAMRAAEEKAAKGIIEETESFEIRKVDSPSIVNFIIPLAVFMLATWYFDYNTLNGVVVAILFTIPLLLIQKISSMSTIVDTIISGFNSMMHPMLVVISSFVLQRLNDELGLSSFILEAAVPYMNASFLPLITFVVLSLLAFATGSFWGVYAIALPVVFPLAQALDANIPLTMGALVSAGVFGSHACFFGDSTVITAKGAGCTPYSHALTQLPYASIAAILSCILFFILG